ncbi:unnamed protein product [Phytophthora lilii]|uniref:Unnamed protein product n=1 Tax=Phytophthora lilii TaxID=2077276 RepID=A0A9W6WPP8_9STRA|nr:unnamed protein product [Phytophthora lilii]
MGWSDRRKVDYEKRKLHLVMSKCFPHLNAQDFYVNVLQAVLARDLPKTVQPCFDELLQKIDENGVVLYRCAYNAQTGRVHWVHNWHWSSRRHHASPKEESPAPKRAKSPAVSSATAAISGSSRPPTSKLHQRNNANEFLLTPRFSLPKKTWYRLKCHRVRCTRVNLFLVVHTNQMTPNWLQSSQRRSRAPQRRTLPTDSIRRPSYCEAVARAALSSLSRIGRAGVGSMESTSAVALPASDLPACWTPTDQRIMEHLLLDQSDFEDHRDAAKQDAASSPRTVELNRASEKQKRSPSKGPATDKTKQVEEERRARHRAVQRRFIQRKKAEAERTKLLAQSLERKYRYLEISAEERDLKVENRELQDRVEAASAAVPTVPHVDPVQLLVQLVREFYEPPTPQVLASVQLNAQQEYELSRRDDSFKSSGASIMGWSDFRKVEESSVKFVLSKGFPNVRALDLMNLTWETLSTPSTYAKFFSPAFPIKVCVFSAF